MLDISSFLSSGVSKWKFTKYFTGVERNSEERNLAIQKEMQDEEECNNRPRDVESIKQYCIEWSQNHIGVDFKFREYQLEYIVAILNNILNDDVKINCLEAPTGSGKSWIALIIAGVAWEYYRKTSYILVSDIGLLNQYWDDVQKHHLYNVGHLKGMANYICDVNGMVFPSGECRLKKIGYEVLLQRHVAAKKGYNCVDDCPCLIDRKKAMLAPISIMTYVLYLCFINDVLPMYSGDFGKRPPFEERDIVICDEVHKLPSIVQSYCSPVFEKIVDMTNFSNLIDSINDHHLFDGEESDWCTTDNLLNYQYKIIDSTDKKDAFTAFMNYYDIQTIIFSKVGLLRKMIDEKQKNGGTLEKEDRILLHSCSWIENRQSHFDKYPHVIDKIGYDKLVINSDYNSKTKTYNRDKFTINCVYEEYLVKEFFNDKCNYQVMMSATLGDCQLFRREIGVDIWSNEEIQKKFRFGRIPSTFDFSKSPIYVLPNYKMTFALKEKNMPYVIQLIDSILQRHQGQKGIIHTGSYEFSKAVKYNSNTKHRLLCYDSARDKDVCLDEYAFQKDKVLVGPTLIEGINLPDDECRFMIIMKVPYPSLADKLVDAKKDIIPNWYNGETIKSVIQSLGRGIRHKNDWCITYVIDGSFCTIYNATKDNLSDDLKNRIQFVTC